ncbi:hypothetical protein [Roseinatronobacter sp. NSM]|uniref:hypothetical protein n=1 Tax=Roseinatronobacter sp. NSM TaxID=3457785 RepID=UPI0040373517
MSTEQNVDFRKRRSEIIKTHLRNDPRIKAARRRVRRNIVFGAFSYILVLAFTLLLAKSVTMAMNDPAAYRQMVAPVIGTLPETHIAYVALMPDPVSTQIASVLRPYVNSGAADNHDVTVLENSQTVPLSLQQQN